MFRVRESVRGVHVGATFGSRTVLGVPFSRGNRQWAAVVQCQCKRVDAVNCEWLARSFQCAICSGQLPATHGASYTKLYQVWRSIKSRCTNKKRNDILDKPNRLARRHCRPILRLLLFSGPLLLLGQWLSWLHIDQSLNRFSERERN